MPPLNISQNQLFYGGTLGNLCSDRIKFCSHWGFTNYLFSELFSVKAETPAVSRGSVCLIRVSFWAWHVIAFVTCRMALQDLGWIYHITEMLDGTLEHDSVPKVRAKMLQQSDPKWSLRKIGKGAIKCADAATHLSCLLSNKSAQIKIVIIQHNFLLLAIDLGQIQSKNQKRAPRTLILRL